MKVKITRADPLPDKTIEDQYELSKKGYKITYGTPYRKNDKDDWGFMDISTMDELKKFIKDTDDYGVVIYTPSSFEKTDGVCELVVEIYDEYREG